MKIRSAIAVVVATFGAITLTAVPAAASVEAYCGMVVTDAGARVTLSTDLDCTAPPAPGGVPSLTPVITIAAPSVTLDLQGHTLTGDSYRDYDGILVSGSKRSVITNGRIRGFGLSIEVRGSGELTLSNLDIEGSGYVGIDIQGSAYVDVSDVTITGLDAWLVREILAGINVRDSHHVSISRVTQSLSGQNGVSFVNSHDFVLQDSQLASNEVAGVLVMGATSAGSVHDVTVIGSGSGVNAWNIPDPGTGAPALRLERIAVDGTHGRTPTTAHDRNGVYIADAHGIEVNELHATDASNGVTILGETRNITVTNSTAERSVAYGFGVTNVLHSETANITLRNNTASGNGAGGFVFQNSWVNSDHNVANGNTGPGFRWSRGPGGASASDAAKFNSSSGFVVAVDPSRAVQVSDAVALGNSESGLTVEAGRAVVVGGQFTHNRLQGVFARAGSLDATKVHSNNNGRSGVYFSGASAGSVTKVTAMNNRTYGLAITAGASVVDAGRHTLVHNRVADLCSGSCRP